MVIRLRRLLFAALVQRFFSYFFADDSLNFCRAWVEDVVAIQTLLSLYEKASGQKINSAKTTLFFSKNVSDFTKETIKNLLGVAELKEYEKYLGLPLVVGRNKKVNLNYIKDRVWGKIQGLMEKLLSQTGKEVLLKAVVQAISTFTMSCFCLPVAFAKTLRCLSENFGGNKGEIEEKFSLKEVGGLV